MAGRKRDEAASIEGARISCPLRGTDVDIEECMACGRLRRVVDDDPPYVVCTALNESWRATEIVF
jgi:hypothetical protein